jgi:glutaredoxin-related protein
VCAAAGPPKEETKEELDARINALINDSRLMLFIKGSYDWPKCKYSRRLMHLLIDNDIARFGYFDILTDKAVWEGLKLISEWKTYPQIFVDGKLLGGLDVFSTIIEEGRLRSVLPADVFAKIPASMKVKLIVNQKGLVLFMNGTPENPSDERSKLAVQILQSAGVPFNHFDVSASALCREGLPDYAGTAEVPQLWADQNLVGGFPMEGDDQDHTWLEEFKPKPKAEDNAGPPPLVSISPEVKENKAAG